LDPDWSEALLLIDEPQPGSQFPCDQATGVCLAYGNGEGGGYYGGGPQSPNAPQNRNVFQAPGPSGNSIIWPQIPVDSPGQGFTRTFRFTNLRVNASGLAPGTKITATVTATQLPITGSTVALG